MATVTELHQLTAIRDQTIRQYAATIAEETSKHIDAVLDNIIDTKINFDGVVSDNDLEGVVRLGIRTDVLSRLTGDLAEKTASTRNAFKQAWWRRSSQ